ncbi:hypothetical protein K501DRAFT_307952 [Backusella circina FSU 941]|nr:hypothetical protein K501DRAFT_307952 [Backusella circina FSU 941]
MSEEDLCDSLDSSFGSLSLPFKSTLSDDQYLEDGPVFRATIQQLENRTGALKQSLKRIIKTASSLLETRQYLARVNQNYMDALRNAPYLEPLMSHYLNAASVTIEEEQKSIDTSLQDGLIVLDYVIQDKGLVTMDIDVNNLGLSSSIPAHRNPDRGLRYRTFGRPYNSHSYRNLSLTDPLRRNNREHCIRAGCIKTTYIRSNYNALSDRDPDDGSNAPRV